ncbi:GumC family protein [Iningainema tapete]|uniref:Polysaccharide biosynthesis tyrosine autokinase n=1 Tax=Iningainema tapete BLCC-T55 TaxID=2748662 RepID=A0A8J7CBL4_9CYAN|nr:polysaccharide biosynthesis tyrosine autokinase [Iningainema tapete]MBD2778486.1 polysaccharide biosynthesis tyrosine autokinase [Iningainema tapete BLCC-T55]
MEKNIVTLLAVARRRSFPALATFTAVIAGAITYITVTPKLYETSARLILDDKSVSVSELGRDLAQVRSTVPGGASPLADQAELVKSQRVLKRALNDDSLKDINSTQMPIKIDDLSQCLSVKILPATNILEVSCKNKNPELATKIVNAVAQAMVDDNTQVIRKEAASVVKFLRTRVPEARQRLEVAELAENKQRQSSGIVSFDEQTKSAVESLAALEDQERTLNAQLREAKSRDASLRGLTEAKELNTALSTVRGGQDEDIKRLRATLSELDAKLIDARARYTESHPTVIKLTEERDALRNLYNQNLQRVSPNNQAIPSRNIAGDQLSQELTSKLITNDVERKAIENKLSVVQTNRALLQKRLAQLPIEQQPLTALTRRRQEAAESLKSLQGKLEEARIAEAQLVGNVQIIEAAQVPTLPTSPKRNIILAVAVAFGSILALGVILLLELMDNTLKDASEAEEQSKLPLLGVLPRLPAKTLVLAPSERFLDDVGLVEPYRMLFKTIEFRQDERLRLMVVTSTISGEGKSVVASHLAAVAAMLSWRTLIIDADLRRPVQHTLFNLPPKPGITDVIDGEKSFQETVQRTDVENLDVLTCGELRSRPSQLLESPAMKSILQEAAQNYDLVIIDTPPLSACADASTLSRLSDGIIMVTRPSFTIKEVLSRAVSELSRNRIPVLGVVVNGMTSMTETYYRYSVNGYKPTKRLTGLSETANSPKRSRSK